MGNRSSGSPVPGPARLVGGVVALGSLTLLGLAALVKWHPPAEIGSMVEAVSPGALLLLVLLLPLDFVLGGLRYRVFFNGRVFPKVSLWHCIRANWANAFLGSITPSQTGGGPAQVYVLCRRGAALPQAVLVSFLNFIATLLFFGVGGLVALAFIPERALNPAVTGVLVTAVVGVLVIAALLVAALFVQSRTIRLFRLVVTGVTGFSQRTRRWGTVVLGAVDNHVAGLRAGVRSIASGGKMTLVRAALVTPVLFLNKYLMGFVLARALQASVDTSFIGLQLLQSVVLYFAPTPGASGFAEASSGVLLRSVLGGGTLLLWVVGWRLLTTFFATILGALVLMSEARRHFNGPGEGVARERAA